jgi:hypothetical protein
MPSVIEPLIFRTYNTGASVAAPVCTSAPRAQPSRGISRFTASNSSGPLPLPNCSCSPNLASSRFCSAVFIYYATYVGQGPDVPYNSLIFLLNQCLSASIRGFLPPITFWHTYKHNRQASTQSENLPSIQLARKPYPILFVKRPISGSFLPV